LRVGDRRRGALARRPRGHVRHAVGGARKDAFGATLTFEEPAAAERLAGALRSDAIPQPMQAALEDLAVSGRDVRIRFLAVEEVALTERGPGHVAVRARPHACRRRTS
jgi:hypothetical protein